MVSTVMFHLHKKKENAKKTSHLNRCNLKNWNNLMCNVHINTSGDCRLKLSASRNEQDIKEISFVTIFPNSLASTDPG